MNIKIYGTIATLSIVTLHSETKLHKMGFELFEALTPIMKQNH